MTALECEKCGMRASHADAQIADRLRTCGSGGLVAHSPLGALRDGEKHAWSEVDK